MNIYQVAGLIFSSGAAGGVVNCTLVGSQKFLPGYTKVNVWNPGWIGSLFLGGVAAVLIWGLYGPSASFDLLGAAPYEGHLTLAQLVTSVLVGMGGNRILTLEAQKLILREQRNEEEVAKENVAKVMRFLIDQPNGSE